MPAEREKHSTQHVVASDMLRDTFNPNCLLPAYDSSDHLHPGLQGLRAIAEEVAVEWFE